MNSRDMQCHLIQPGQVEYRAAWKMQRALADRRALGQIGDTLFVLEHPHTYTLGRSARREHLLLSEEVCRERGITVVDVDRGGDITYHGPGQLVAYPIRYLGTPDYAGRIPQVDYVGYVRRLEEVLIQTVGDFGIRARPEAGYSGAWVDMPGGPLKIAAIGVRVNAVGVSTHGVALNIAPDLSYFDGIIPCGIADKGVTSMAELLGSDALRMDVVRSHFCVAFERVFACRLVPAPLDSFLEGVNLP